MYNKRRKNCTEQKLHLKIVVPCEIKQQMSGNRPCDSSWIEFWFLCINGWYFYTKQMVNLHKFNSLFSNKFELHVMANIEINSLEITKFHQNLQHWCERLRWTMEDQKFSIAPIDSCHIGQFQRNFVTLFPTFFFSFSNNKCLEFVWRFYKHRNVQLYQLHLKRPFKHTFNWFKVQTQCARRQYYDVKL